MPIKYGKTVINLKMALSTYESPKLTLVLLVLDLARTTRQEWGGKS